MLKSIFTGVFVFVFYLSFSQNKVYCEFNKSTKEELYKYITNVIYVKRGLPSSIDGSLEITPLGRKKYALRLLDPKKDSVELLITEEITNPESQLKENVVLDRKRIKILETEQLVEICIGNNTKTTQNIINEKLGLCTNIDNDLKIVSYNIVINKLLIKVVGSRFNDKVIKAINEAKNKQEIQIELTFKNVLEKETTINAIFVKE